MAKLLFIVLCIIAIVLTNYPTDAVRFCEVLDFLEEYTDNEAVDRWTDILNILLNIPEDAEIPENFNHCQWIYAVPSNSIEYQLIRLLNTDIPVPDESLGAFGLPNTYTLEWLSDLFSDLFKVIRAILTAHTQGVHVRALRITGDNGLLAHIVELLNVSVGDIH